MTDITLSSQEYMKIKRGHQKCVLCGRGGKSKYGNVPVVDPETGRRIASKKEAQALADWRRRASDPIINRSTASPLIIAEQPMFFIEGGTYRGDILIVSRSRFQSSFTDHDNVMWYYGLFRVQDIKGHDTKSSRKSRRQVKERYGVEVEVVK